MLADTRYSPSPRVPSCKAQDTRTRTCRTSLQVVGKGATKVPFPLYFITCSSVPHIWG